ncbi:hypothetical protein [Actinopolymorpha cephalotaxi]|uniref:hypothetical protein n=1 Tax=Actinopolymorpha cephalotaxi TaxID=504797 RepID=UPI00192D0065
MATIRGTSADGDGVGATVGVQSRFEAGAVLGADVAGVLGVLGRVVAPDGAVDVVPHAASITDATRVSPAATAAREPLRITGRAYRSPAGHW